MRENFSLAPSEIIQRTLPVNFQEQDRKLFEREVMREFPAVETISLVDAKINYFGIIKQNWKYRLDLCFWGMKRSVFSSLKWYGFLLFQDILNTFFGKKRYIKKGFLLNDCFSAAFFHVFGDIVQKMEALLELEKKHLLEVKDITIVVPGHILKSYTKTIFDLYKHFGFSFEIVEKFSVVGIEEAFYVPQITPTGNYRPHLMQQARQRFRDFFHIGQGKKRIYITRKKAPIRHISNEEELFPILEKRGFSIVAMEDFSLEDQIRLVGEAEILVGLHGAGLTHMLWMRNGAAVLEIRIRDDTHNNCYFSLASALNLKYYYMCAEKVDERKTTQETDVIVSSKVLEKVLDKLLENVS